MNDKTIIGSKIIEILQQSKCAIIYCDQDWAPILVGRMEYGYERSRRVQERLQEDAEPDDEDVQEDDDYLLDIGDEFYLVTLDKNQEYHVRDNGIEITIAIKSLEVPKEIKVLLVPMIINHAITSIANTN